MRRHRSQALVLERLGLGGLDQVEQRLDLVRVRVRVRVSAHLTLALTLALALTLTRTLTLTLTLPASWRGVARAAPAGA